MSRLAGLGFVVLLAVVSAPAQVLYPAPPGLTDSPRFDVQVNVGGVWSNSFVNFNPVRTFGSGSTDQPGKSFSWTTFGTAGPTTVGVQRQVGAFASCVIRPTRYGITATNIGGNTVEFSIQPGQKVSVEFNTDIKSNYYDGTYGIPSVTNLLMVFADPIRVVGGTNGVAAADILFVSPGTNQTNVTVAGSTPPSAGKCTLGHAGGKKVVGCPNDADPAEAALIRRRSRSCG
jgi:hypothetical protein